jgi:hypothetical protein
MTDDDEYIDNENLLIEAARYSIAMRQSRNMWMKRAKQCWYKAAAEHGFDDRTMKRWKTYKGIKEALGGR